MQSIKLAREISCQESDISPMPEVGAESRGREGKVLRKGADRVGRGGE